VAVPHSDFLLAGMMVLFVGTFGWLAWLTHARFGTFGFDLGIFDQGVWLLSRFQDPFVTIRGPPLFGDHASYILLLVAPLYWLWADPRLLLLLQVVFLAIPAVSIYLIGTRRLSSPLAGLAMAAAYLAFPAVQWAAIWHFHPETLAADAGIQPSMGSVGDSLDNALAENFFSILKVERIYRTSYRTGRRPSLTCSATSTAGTTPTASNASLAG
jgi:hypothetical protein